MKLKIHLRALWTCLFGYVCQGADFTDITYIHINVFLWLGSNFDLGLVFGIALHVGLIIPQSQVLIVYNKDK